ncbi:hypothetical protein BDZ89DRAFT_1140772 [Hymenopellis radicata]|nr:hypothetical protein BDZ89DRAFT_1140772 [Hymenopellis radicata]
MTAALPLHAALGLDTPLAGLYFDHFKGYTFLATLAADRNGSLQPLIHSVLLNWRSKSLNFMNESLHIWHVRSIIANLRKIAKCIVFESTQCSADTALHVCAWPDKSRIQPSDLGENRRPVDILHPPLVAGDALLHFLFSLELTFIEEWLEKSGIVTGAPQTSVELPTHIREWIDVFKGSLEVGRPHVLEIIEDSKKGISDDAHRLIAPFLSALDSVSPVQALSTADVSFSLTFCSYARDLQNVSVSSLDRHSLTTHWMSLYNSLFSRAWQAKETNLIFNHCPPWHVHHCFRRSDEGQSKRVPFLEEMRPNVAFLMGLPEDCLILPKGEWSELSKHRQEGLKFDFAVTTHYNRLHWD